MSEGIESRVLAFVRSGGSVTAVDVSRSLGCSRGEVNSVLYAGLGIHFRKSQDQQPQWSLLQSERGAVRQSIPHTIGLVAHHDFHIDFAGGDWRFRIVVGDASRNDPVARIEVLGVRHLLVTVAAYACGEDLGPFLPPAAIAIASSVLAWEIHQSLRVRGIEAFHFEEAVRDIFLSLTWQSAELEENIEGLLRGKGTTADNGLVD